MNHCYESPMFTRMSANLCQSPRVKTKKESKRETGPTGQCDGLVGKVGEWARMSGKKSLLSFPARQNEEFS